MWWESRREVTGEMNGPFRSYRGTEDRAGERGSTKSAYENARIKTY